MKKFVTSVLLLLVACPALHAARTVFSGRLLGHDNQPMARAEVHLATGERLSPFTSARADSDGTYLVETDRTGLIYVQFSGVDHASYTVPVMVSEPHEINIDVVLGTHIFGTDYAAVTIIGDFNGFAFRSGRPLARQKDGTYSITMPASGESFSYQLVFPGDGTAAGGSFSANGTASERYASDQQGDFRSVVTPANGSVTITFNPAKLPPPGLLPAAKIYDRSVEHVSSLIQDIGKRGQRLNAYLEAQTARGETPSPESLDWSGEAQAIAMRATRVPDREMRRALLYSYLTLAGLGYHQLDTGLVQLALAELGPTSPYWSLQPGVLSEVISSIGTSERNEAFRWRLIREHPDTVVRVEEIAATLRSISAAGEPERFRSYFDYLTTSFPGNREAGYVRSELDPDGKTQIGHAVPPFSLVSIDDGTKISNETMKGTLYLIDFWATWCGPCVGEMPNLHAAYDRYHAKGFEIVSISFDRSVDDIAKFRQKKWKMPWKHGFAEGAFGGALGKEFEVMGIPKPILVNAAGTIVATENDLRGANLEKTLARLLGAKAN
ncbi:MAG TPA: thioredoxin-like domain-containing protein [Candidatus Kapabacteria bacterium]|nr:thioredoxin-like domain-containing protein [Candidatus Kapabacteria bacterium]